MLIVGDGILYKLLCVIYVYFSAFIILVSIITIFRKIHPEKTFDSLLSKRFFSIYFIRDVLFFVIVFLVFIGALPVSIGISQGISELGDFPLVESGLFSNIIIILSGVIVRFIYCMIRLVVNKIMRKNMLTYIGENSRTWAFIMASSCYVAIGFMKGKNLYMQLIGFNALSIILGRVFWIDCNKNVIKNILSSFFSLDYRVIFIYAIIIVGDFNVPIVNFISIPLASIAMSLGIISAIVMIIFMYRKEFCKYIVDFIEKELKNDGE